MQSVFEELLLSQKQQDELVRLRAAEARGPAAPLAAGPVGSRSGGVLQIGEPLDKLVRTFPARSVKPAPEKPKREEPTGAKKIEIDLLKQLNSESARLTDTQTALDSLRSRGIINQEQYNKTWAETVLHFQNVSSASDVLKAKFLEIDTSVGTLAASIGDTLVGAIDRASGALADFAISGFRNVQDLRKGLADLLQGLARDIVALIIKTLILKAIQESINAFGGGAGGSTGGGLASGSLTGSIVGGIAGRAAGGPVLSGVPVPVGERGPEIFVPPSSGNIVPNSQIAAGPPEVNVKVVNVTNPKDVTDAMGSPEGERVIFNTLSRNPRLVQQLAAGR